MTERGGKTRAQLLRAAERVFGAKTFEGASISDITQRAGVAQGTFYVHFQDKHAIFVELVELLGSSLRKELHEAVEGVSPRLEVERAGFRAFFRFCGNHRDLYRIVRQAEFVAPEAHRAYYEKLAEGYVRGLKKAMSAKEIRRSNPERLAYCLMGIADFLGMRWLLWEQEASVEGLETEAMALISHGLKPPKEAVLKSVSRGTRR